MCSARACRVFAVVLCLLAGGRAWGATIVANGTTCTLANAIRSANTATSIGGCTQGSGGGDQIQLTYDVVLSSAEVTYGSSYGGAYAGLPEINRSMTIVGDGNGHTIERNPTYGCAEGDPSAFRLLNAKRNSTDSVILTLKKLTLRNGCVASSGDAWGGAILLSPQEWLTLEDCTLTGNVARTANGSARGGAVALLTPSVVTALTITRSTISQNTARAGKTTAPNGDAYGGAISFEFSLGFITIADSTFTDNLAATATPTPGSYFSSYAIGGAIAMSASGGFSSPIAIERSVFERNTASAVDGGGHALGGALRLDDVPAQATLDLRQLVFRGNRALGGIGRNGEGGGLYMQGSTVDELSGCLFESNEARGGDDANSAPGYAFGGGMSLDGDIGKLKDTTFSLNLARGGNGKLPPGDASGGGLYLLGGSATEIANLTFSANTAQGGSISQTNQTNGAGLGGGMSAKMTIARLSHITMAGNVAAAGRGTAGAGVAEGGGLRIERDSVSADNLLLAANFINVTGSAVNGDCWASPGTYNSAGGNFIEKANHSTSNPCTPNTSRGDRSAFTVTGLAPVADNGCTIRLPIAACVPTMALAISSNVLDKGRGDGATSVDARGGTRPYDFSTVSNDPGNGDPSVVPSDGTDPGAFELVPINHAPSFTSGGNVNATEDTPYSATWTSDVSPGAGDTGQTPAFVVVSNSNPSLFSSGPGISVSGMNGVLAFTPATNRNGSSTVQVKLTDDKGTQFGGVNESGTVTFTINVAAVNDPPSFTIPASAPPVDEDSVAQTVSPFATSISPGGWTDESSQTLTFNVSIVSASSTLTFSQPPAIDSITGKLTYAPTPNAYGTATISATLSDDGGGSNISAAQTFTITVNAVNDAPVNTVPIAQNISEDLPLVFSTGNGNAIAVADADAGTSPFRATLTATNGTVSAATGSTATLTGNGTANLVIDGTLAQVNQALSAPTFTPAANFNGTASLQILSSDLGASGSGGTKTDSDFVTINVAPVNDPPTFTQGAAISVNEDSGAYPSGANWATGIGPGGGPDESAQTTTFSVTNDNNALFSAQPAISSTGTLTFTTAANMNGVANVTTTLTDSSGASTTKTFPITIAAVNDAPSFTAGGNVTVLEDSGPYSAAAATAISAGPSDESTQSVSFTYPNNNNGLFTALGQPKIFSSGVLTFTPAPNANGSATLTVTATDSGSPAASSSPQSFTITVSAVNDPPSFANLGGEVEYSPVDANPVRLDADAVLADPELDALNNWNGATLTVKRQGGANATDHFSFITPLAGATSTEVAGLLTISFTTATAAQADTILASIAYSRADALTAAITLLYEINDGSTTEQDTVAATVTVNPRTRTPTAVLITLASPNPVIVGGDVSVAVTVPASGTTPQGQVRVEFTDGAHESCTVTLNGGGGTCSVRPLTAGSRNLIATYLGSLANSMSTTQQPTPETVNQAATATTLSVPASSIAGNPVTVTATVTATPSTTNPSGTVTVTATSSGSAPKSCIATIANGTGTCNLTDLLGGTGTWTIAGTFVATSDYTASTSASVTHTVGKIATTTAINSHTPSPSTFNQSVLVIVYVTSASGTPTGNVIVTDDTGATSGNCALNGGIAACSITPTVVGSNRTLTATYQGSNLHATSVSASVVHPVQSAGAKATVTTIGTITPASPAFGSAITVPVTVTAPDGGTPTGTVDVRDHAGNFCTITLGTQTQCSLTPSGAGTRAIIATYVPATTDFASSVKTTTIAVTPATTTTTIAGHTPSPSTAGAAVTVSVNVTSSVSTTFATPSGTATITNGSVSCVAAIAGGAGSCALTLPAGSHTLTATYAGSADFAASPVSASVTHVVNATTTPRRRGDVNGNGVVNALDASLVLQAVVGAIQLGASEQCAADYDASGSYSTFDAALILKCSVEENCTAATCNN